MRIERIALRDFRSYEGAELEPRSGPDHRARPQRRGQDEPPRGPVLRLHRALLPDQRRAASSSASALAPRASRSAASTATGRHELAVGLEPGQAKRMTADGAPVERLLDVPFRPLVSVFSPDRLELIKGGPGAAPRPPRSGRGRAVAGARRDASRTTARRSRSATRCSGASGPGRADGRCAGAVERDRWPPPRSRSPRDRGGRGGADRRALRAARRGARAAAAR